MTEELVTFETAKLAREKGFDEPCMYAFVDREDKVKEVNPTMGLSAFDLIANQYKLAQKNPSAMANLRWRLENHLVVNSTRAGNCYARPTQDLLVRWLREVHNLSVGTYVYEDGSWQWIIQKMGTRKEHSVLPWDISGKPNVAPTYELAREAALQHALKLLPDALID